jgi:hypothetical protein
MTETLNAPALTEETMALFLLGLGDDAVIPCTNKGIVKAYMDIRNLPICGDTAAWAFVKVCGHEGYNCESHFERVQASLNRVKCSVCNSFSEPWEIKWRRL